MIEKNHTVSKGPPSFLFLRRLFTPWKKKKFCLKLPSRNVYKYYLLLWSLYILRTVSSLGSSSVQTLVASHSEGLNAIGIKQAARSTLMMLRVCEILVNELNIEEPKVNKNS